MTQFLLAAIRNPRVPTGYEALDARGFEALEQIAGRIFPNAKAVAKVAPTNDEMDSVVDATRGEMSRGVPFEASQLGTLLGGLVAQCDFALFWASDHENLPLASSVPELCEVLTPQVLTKSGNWELYVHFVGTPSGRS